MEKGLSVVKVCDFLGYRHGLVFNGQRRTKTCLGGILSIILVILLSCGLVFFGRELVYRDNPILVLSEKMTEESTISLKRLGLQFAPINIDSSFLLDDEEFMKGLQIRALMVDFTSKDGKAVSKFTPLKVERCQESFFEPENWQLRSKELNMSEWLCINPYLEFDGETFIEKEQFIRNEWSSFGARGLWINFKMCDSTKNPGCDKWLQTRKDFYLLSMMNSFYFDAIDYENPIKRTVKTNNPLIGIGLSFIDYMTVLNKTAVLDNGLLFDDSSEKSFHSFGPKEMGLQTFDPNNPNLYDMIFQCSTTQNQYRRRYVRIQEVVADVGGIFKILIIVFGSLSKIIGEYAFFNEFNASLRTSKMVDDTVKHVRIRQSASHSSTSNIRINRKNSTFSIKTSKISFFTILLSKISPLSAKKKGFDRSSVSKYYDIAYLATQLKEKEKDNES